MHRAIIRAAVFRAIGETLGLLGLLALSYLVLGRWPRAGTWIVLGSLIAAATAYRAWRKIKGTW